MTNAAPIERRPLKSRSAAWTVALAALCVRLGIAPNAISVMSTVFAALGALCLVGASFSAFAAQPLLVCALPVVAALCIQLRLVCNLIDGMVAVEGNRRSPTGELFNEIPDRFADAFVMIGAGYAARSLPGGIELGWTAAVFAVLTAYLRAFGKSLGLPGLFIGPMAKPQRMAVMTVAAIGSAIAAPWTRSADALWLALALVVLGCAVTCWRRISAIARHVQAPPTVPSTPPVTP